MNINLGKLDIVSRFAMGAGAIAIGIYVAFVQGNIYGLALGFNGDRINEVVSDVCYFWT